MRPDKANNIGPHVNMIDSRYGVKLNTLLAIYRNTHYFCQIYVRNNDWIDMAKFTPQDVLDKMDEAIDEIEFLFFYVE
jgi:hypothetical protein